MSNMDQPITTFRSIIEAVMTNWTALKMAVELSPSPVMWKDHALDLINNVCDSFETTGTDINAPDLEDYLTEYLDANFHTICEDESPQQISQLLMKLYHLWISGNTEELSRECIQLPKADFTWLHTPKNNINLNYQENRITPIQEADEDGWITVTKKK